MSRFRTLALSVVIVLSACSDTEDPQEFNEGEAITTIVLSFAPDSGGEALEFRWTDPEQDGSPEIDPIPLSDGEAYGLSVSFLNEFESPAEDITEEVAAESDEHQVFLTGDAVQGPATGSNAAAVLEHSYDDVDDGGLPVGLENRIETLTAGDGTLTITLRHLPPENDNPVKVDGLAEDVASGGFDGIPGDTDVQVSFAVTVE